METEYFVMEQFPVNVEIIGLMPPEKIERRVKYVDDGQWAPLWRWMDGPEANQMAPWPLAWRYLTEDDNG